MLTLVAMRLRDPNCLRFNFHLDFAGAAGGVCRLCAGRREGRSKVRGDSAGCSGIGSSVREGQLLLHDHRASRESDVHTDEMQIKLTDAAWLRRCPYRLARSYSNCRIRRDVQRAPTQCGPTQSSMGRDASLINLPLWPTGTLSRGSRAPGAPHADLRRRAGSAVWPGARARADCGLEPYGGGIHGRRAARAVAAGCAAHVHPDQRAGLDTTVHPRCSLTTAVASTPPM